MLYHMGKQTIEKTEIDAVFQLKSKNLIYAFP